MRTPAFLGVVGIAAVIATAQARATTYDALAGFSVSNPSGAWSYGDGTAGSSFTAYPSFGAADTLLPALSGWSTGTGSPPYVGINNTGSTAVNDNNLLPTNVLLVHPGLSTDTIVQWTAPAAGTYSITGLFEELDALPTAVNAEIYDGATLLFSQELNGPDPNLTTLTPGGNTTFSLNVTAALGTVLSFAVHNDGAYIDELTGFDATITGSTTPPATVPEPATLALLGASLFCLTARRSRARK